MKFSPGIGLFIFMFVIDASASSSSPEPTREATEAEVLFSKAWGVSTKETARRFKLRDAAVPLRAKIIEEFRDRYAGGYVSDDSMTIVVRLTGDKFVPERIISTPHGNMRFTFATGAKHSIVQIRRVVSSGRVQRVFGDQSTAVINQRDGSIVVSTTDADSAKAFQEVERHASELLDGIPVKVVKDSFKPKYGEPVDAHGSNAIVPALSRVSATDLRAGGRGHNSGSYCTFSFRAYDNKTGKAGMLSAGHCPETMNYSSVPGSHETVSTDLTGTKKLWDSSHDVQWYPEQAPYLATWTLFSGGASSLPALLSEPIRDVLEGFVDLLIVCQRGATTGYSCGTLVAVDAAPANPILSNQQQCENTWMLAEGPLLQCAGGDSGAPATTTGYSPLGVVTAMKGDDVCDGVYFMGLSRIESSLDLTIR